MPATVSNTATIPINETTSDAVDLQLVDHLGSIVGIQMPAAFTGASISFQVSGDDSTYQALYDSSNTLLSITVSASRTYGFTDSVRATLAHWRYIKIVSASSEAAARSIKLITK